MFNFWCFKFFIFYQALLYSWAKNSNPEWGMNPPPSIPAISSSKFYVADEVLCEEDYVEDETELSDNYFEESNSETDDGDQ